MEHEDPDLGAAWLTAQLLDWMSRCIPLRLVRHRKNTHLWLTNEVLKKVEAKQKAETRRAEYEAFMLEERKKTSTWADSERHKISDEAREIVQGGREASNKEVEAIRANREVELGRARKELSPLILEYASAIATRLLGRKVTVSSGPSKSASQTEQAVRS